VQPGNKVVVGVVGDDLQCDVEMGAAPELPQDEEHEQRAEEPAATPA
jgi:hypothetical protein